MNELNIQDILKKYKGINYDIINTKKKNYINTRITKIFVINLVDNVIRRNYILVLMKKFNINFSLVVFNRVSEKLYSQFGNKLISKDELGCTLSHMWCLREIIKNKYKNAIIFEDDIIFHKNFKVMFMNMFQNDYDFLLLGACDFSFKSLNKDRIINNGDKKWYENGDKKKELHNSTFRVKLQIDDVDETLIKDNSKEEVLSIDFIEDGVSEKLNFGTSMEEFEIKRQHFENENDNEKDNEIEYDETSICSEKTVATIMPEQSVDKVTYKNVYKPHENSAKVYGAHAIYYSLEGAKTMYENKMTNMSFFDKDYMPIFNKFKKSSFICYPNLVISDISTSNLNHIYHFFSKSEELYYLNCFDNFSFTDYNVIYLDIILKHKGVKIKENDTYEKYISRLVKYQFSSTKERDIIKNRHVMDFFTMIDLEKIRLNI